MQVRILPPPPRNENLTAFDILMFFFEKHLSNFYYGASQMFNFFKKKKKEPRDLKEILSCFKNLEENFEKLSKEIESLKKESKFSVQKVGMVRYNPFSEVGSDQSFSIALLDGNNSGAVITSLYTREGNRVYGKPIKKGLSKYSLSEEETQAIKIAKKNEEKTKRKLNNPAAGGGSFRSC